MRFTLACLAVVLVTNSVVAQPIPGRENWWPHKLEGTAAIDAKASEVLAGYPKAWQPSYITPLDDVPKAEAEKLALYNKVAGIVAAYEKRLSFLERFNRPEEVHEIRDIREKVAVWRGRLARVEQLVGKNFDQERQQREANSVAFQEAFVPGVIVSLLFFWALIFLLSEKPGDRKIQPYKPSKPWDDEESRKRRTKQPG